MSMDGPAQRSPSAAVSMPARGFASTLFPAPFRPITPRRSPREDREVDIEQDGIVVEGDADVSQFDDRFRRP